MKRVTVGWSVLCMAMSVVTMPALAGTNPPPHEQVEAHHKAQKVAKHVHDKQAQQAQRVTVKASDTGK